MLRKIIFILISCSLGINKNAFLMQNQSTNLIDFDNAMDLGARRIQQDAVDIYKDDNLFFCGVYDGHGLKGERISQFLKENLWKNIKLNLGVGYLPEAAMSIGFLKTSTDLVSRSGIPSYFVQNSGSTALCLLIKDGMLYVANAGDCRAIFCCQNGSEKKVLSLSVEHKVYLEEKRIIKMNGIIKRDKNNLAGPDSDRIGGKNVARGFGDIAEELLGIINEPDILTLNLRTGEEKFSYIDPSDGHIGFCNGINQYEKLDFKPEFLIIASDGLWDKWQYNVYEDSKYEEKARNNVTELLQRKPICFEEWLDVERFKNKILLNYIKDFGNKVTSSMVYGYINECNSIKSCARYLIEFSGFPRVRREEDDNTTVVVVDLRKYTDDLH